MGIFNNIYNFFYNWLFAEASVLSAGDATLVCILLSVVVLCWVLWLAIMPIKAIISAVFRG